MIRTIRRPLSSSSAGVATPDEIPRRHIIHGELATAGRGIPSLREVGTHAHGGDEQLLAGLAIGIPGALPVG